MIVKKFSINTKTNWYKFSENEVLELKKIFKKNYQIPIHVKR